MNKKTQKTRSGFLLIILIVVMIVTNPSKDDFYDWASNQALENSETVIGGAITNLFVSPILKSVTVRKDYIVCSTYHVDLDDDEIVYLGIFKQFIEIKK
jgi:hypothetical protein